MFVKVTEKQQHILYYASLIDKLTCPPKSSVKRFLQYFWLFLRNF